MDLTDLARPSGGLAMVAADQRESLRVMMAEHTSGPVTDEDLVRFKLAVARETGDYASGFLIDRTFGFDQILEAGLLPGKCGLILACDDLRYSSAGVVGDTALDDMVDAHVARQRGAVALKLLVIWRRDANRDRRLAMSEEFVRRCRDADLHSVLEGVVRPEPGADFDGTLLEAAGELGGLRPSLYKVQMPGLGRGTPAAMTRTCEKVTRVVPVPWVVLSQGVRIEDFPGAVETACRAGASGFLAGRAIWSDTLAAPDPVPLLRERSAARLRRLGDLVDRTARPWWETVG
ncbi:MAG: hypothetical protein JOZ47_15270 [Kutzneria sp.]|nr:hypothetical protein [Kutzneria sp.]MBV9846414.1 hypothetical protein [Kutzneria sp.]